MLISKDESITCRHIRTRVDMSHNNAIIDIKTNKERNKAHQD